MRSFWLDHQIEYKERIGHIESMIEMLRKHESKWMEALRSDLGKCEFESFTTEIGSISKDAQYARANLKKWQMPKSISTDLINLPAKSKIYWEPLGLSLIISPWNYPVQLSLGPLLGAISAGCPAVLKPSELSKHTSELLNEMISQYFPKERYQVFLGDKQVAQELLQQKWDFIFFTGSTAVGKIVYESAAKNLTPVVLELGGKSPALIRSDANLHVTSKRMAWGKFLNAGQTCIAPDYVLCPIELAVKLKEGIQNDVTNFYGVNPKESADYGRMISSKHVKRLIELWPKNIDSKYFDIEAKYLAPQIDIIGDWKNWDNLGKIMEEEIFGPLLPIITYEAHEEQKLISFLKKQSRPLATYVFTEDKEAAEKFIQELSFGGGCINDCLMHISNPNLPFGGVGQAGLGSYHGVFSFESFSHRKSVLDKSSWVDIPLRYAPYKNKLDFLKKIIF